MTTDLTAQGLALGPDWQAGRHMPRDPEAAIITPSLDEMAAHPGTTQTQYCVTYGRVGRHGGRNSASPAPQPLTVWVVSADALSERIAEDARPYLLSSSFDVLVDLDEMAGSIFCGFQNGGSFTIERLAVFEGGAE